MDNKQYTLLLERYLTYAEVLPGPVHYTSKRNLPLIKKYGLLSPYALLKLDKKLFDEKFIVGYEDIDTPEELFKKARDINLTEKSIFFAFKEVTPGLHKGRDEFIKDALMIRLPLRNLQKNWEYRLIIGREVEIISLKEVIKWCNEDFTKYEKRKGGRFLFSHIPHLAIDTEDGIISIEYLSLFS